MKHPNPGRVLPPRWKHVTRCEFKRVLTWRERLCALLGYTVELNFAMFSEHGPGRIQPEMELKFIKELPDKKGKQ